jgi:hypothetical protein
MTLRTVPSDRDVRTRLTGFRVDLETRYVTICVVSLSLQEGVGESALGWGAWSADCGGGGRGVGKQWTEKESFQQDFYNRYKILHTCHTYCCYAYNFYACWLYFIYVWHVYVSPKTYKWSGTFIIKDGRYAFCPNSLLAVDNYHKQIHTLHNVLRETDRWSRQAAALTWEKYGHRTRSNIYHYKHIIFYQVLNIGVTSWRWQSTAETCRKNCIIVYVLIVGFIKINISNCAEWMILKYLPTVHRTRTECQQTFPEFDPLKPTGYYTYHRVFNTKKIYFLPIKCIYVFCIDLRTGAPRYKSEGRGLDSRCCH